MIHLCAYLSATRSIEERLRLFYPGDIEKEERLRGEVVTDTAILSCHLWLIKDMIYGGDPTHTYPFIIVIFLNRFLPIQLKACKSLGGSGPTPKETAAQLSPKCTFHCHALSDHIPDVKLASKTFRLKGRKILYQGAVISLDCIEN